MSADTASREPRPASSASAGRPARLPSWALFVGLGLLALSFLSGVIIWIGQSVDAGAEPAPGSAPFPLGRWVAIHGALNPYLCGFLGYLSAHHFRVGWRLGVNRLSGSAMILVFGGLALTGTALYYAADEDVRLALVWIHRVLGLALPLVLAFHLIQAVRWVRGQKSEGSP